MLGKILGGLSKAFKAVSPVTDIFKGVMNSPFGGMLAAAFPPAGLAMGGVNILSMLGNMGGKVGGGQNY